MKKRRHPRAVYTRFTNTAINRLYAAIDQIEDDPGTTGDEKDAIVTLLIQDLQEILKLTANAVYPADVTPERLRRRVEQEREAQQ